MKRFLASSSLPIDTIDEAADGQEALLTLRAAPADLILTDLEMPRMDGLTLVRRLRAAGDPTPIILITAHTDPRAIRLAIRAGADTYIPKPINPDLLAEKIQQALAHPCWSAKNRVAAPLH